MARCFRTWTKSFVSPLKRAGGDLIPNHAVNGVAMESRKDRLPDIQTVTALVRVATFENSIILVNILEYGKFPVGCGLFFTYPFKQRFGG